MGVTYKLKDEVVHFIIIQRQGNPLFSCRQLAESVSEKFGLHLSKSSVHDVLKESGIITPRGRKPKTKFEIPQEKKKQIQINLAQVKLLPSPVAPLTIAAPIAKAVSTQNREAVEPPHKEDVETSPEYEGAGKIFVKAAAWDLGIFSEANVKVTDWDYYLTYSKGVRVVLENSKSFFIDLPLPLERCIRETADGLINNLKPFLVHKVSDEVLFKACMDAQAGFKIDNISIVGQDDHVLLYFDNIMDFKRRYLCVNMSFMESNEKELLERSKVVFFTQIADNVSLIDNILNLRGYDTISKDKKTVNLLISDSYDNKTILQEAVERLNAMYLCDEENRLVKIQIVLR